MRFGIAFKLGILLAVFGILASGLTGYYSYLSSRAMLLGTAEHDLLTSTQVLSRNMQASLAAIGKDAQLLASLPRSAKAVTSSDRAAAEENANLLAAVFKSMLSTHPEYFQIRLIRADMNGLEMVRVDRDGESLVRVFGEDLQEKAHYPYVFETLRLQRGGIHLSPITINHEEGAHSGLNKPTLRVATPVIADDGKALGLIVINIDLNGLFDFLKADLPGDYNLYLANESGDFLIHPDPAQTFGFEQGRRVLLQDTFAPALEVVQGKSRNLVMNIATAIDAASAQREKLVAAFVRLPLNDTAGKRSVIIGLSQPMEIIVSEATRLGWHIIQIVLIFSAFALILAAMISRVVTSPLNAMATAITRFSKEHVISPLPLGRSDEIGLLARSFRDMQTETMAYLSELKESKNILEHMARHDPLTGLPNRTLFYDRLQHAIIQARRDRTRLALLFLDLDKFKLINDSLGHHIGDLLLRAAAKRMQECVRESDTVGRLGGDEFVVLLPVIEGQQDALRVAEKIHQAIGQPFDLDGQALTASTSIGVAIYPEHGDDEIQLSVNADRAMYLAKAGGRDRVYLYHS